MEVVVDKGCENYGNGNCENKLPITQQTNVNDELHRMKHYERTSEMKSQSSLWECGDHRGYKTSPVIAEMSCYLFGFTT